MDYEMIAGDWLEGGNLEINAHLHFPGFGLGGPVRFEIDTGASRTILGPSDAERLGIDYSRLGLPIQLGTIGSDVLAHPIPGVVYLTGERQDVGFKAHVMVLNPSTSDLGNSLLGPDVLRRVEFYTWGAGWGFMLSPRAPDSCLEWNPEE